MKNFTLFSESVSFVEIVFFTKHLSVMIRSGITISEALESLLDQTKSTSLRAVIADILKTVENGQPLSSGLSKHPHIFDKLYTSLVEVGEQSGNLDTNLDYLAKKLSFDYALRKKVQGVLLYPTIVLCTAFFVSGYVSIFLLPQLSTFFTSLNANLPIQTQILMFVANLMKAYGILIFSALAALLVGFQFAIKHPKIKPYWDRFTLSIPLIGTFLRNNELVTITRNLGIMIKSGVPLMSALEITERATSNSVFTGYLNNLKKSVSQGEELSHELKKKNYRYIPKIATKMIAVGEKTGKLDEVLVYLSTFFEEELDYSAKNFATILEPLILLIIGVFVAFIASAIISPIYELTGSIHR